jgi:hypothetical protein
VKVATVGLWSARDKTIGGGAVDRWFYVIIAALFMATALAGFSWSTANLIAAVSAGQRPPPPVTTHLHAALAASWLTLLLAQTVLVAVRRTAWHRKLGVAAISVGSALAAIIVVVVWREYLTAAEFGFRDQASNGLLFKAKSVVLFGTFLTWAAIARKRDAETHKRMMILATWALMDAAIARMAGRGWLPALQGDGLAPYDHAHIYQLLLLAPALLVDTVRLGAPHRAYLIGLGLFVPWAIATHFLWDSSGWLSLAPRIMGVS